MKLSAVLVGIAAGQAVTTTTFAPDERRKSSSKGNGLAYG